MRRLVFITQSGRPGRPGSRRDLSRRSPLWPRRVDEVDVLCDRARRRGRCPPNCRVHAFGARRASGARPPLRGVAARASCASGPDAVVAHMVPLYAVLAAPLVRPRGVPLLLWYTHWKRHCHASRRRAASPTTSSASTERSFPSPSAKLRAIGHGIDLERVPVPGRSARRRTGRCALLALGRYSPAKGLDAVLAAVRARCDERARREPDRARARRAQRAASEHNAPSWSGSSPSSALVGRVDSGGQFRDRRSPAALRRSGPARQQHATPARRTRSSSRRRASCLPVLASNPVFDELFAGLEPSCGSSATGAETLAERLQALAALERRRRAQRSAASCASASRRSTPWRRWADGILEPSR